MPVRFTGMRKSGVTGETMLAWLRMNSQVCCMEFTSVGQDIHFEGPR